MYWSENYSCAALLEWYNFSINLCLFIDKALPEMYLCCVLENQHDYVTQAG